MGCVGCLAIKERGLKMNQILDPSKMVKAVPFLPILPPEMLRDLFAAFALAGMCASGNYYESSVEQDATVAYNYADAMLKAREKNENL